MRKLILPSVIAVIGIATVLYSVVGYNSDKTTRVVEYNDGETKIVDEAGFYTRVNFKKDIAYENRVTYEFIEPESNAEITVTGKVTYSKTQE